MEAATLAIVGEHARRASAIEDELDDGVLHVHRHAEIGGVVLQRADQFEAGAIADVGEARIAVAAEVALVDAAIGRAIEHGAPGLELADAIRRFLRVNLGHAPVVDVLAAAHRVGEMDLPAVAIVVVRHGRGHAAFGHHGVRLAKQRLADQTDGDAGAGRFDRRAQTRAARPDDQDVVGIRCMRGHYSSLKSVQIPIEQSRM